MACLDIVRVAVGGSLSCEFTVMGTIWKGERQDCVRDIVQDTTSRPNVLQTVGKKNIRVVGQVAKIPFLHQLVRAWRDAKALEAVLKEKLIGGLFWRKHALVTKTQNENQISADLKVPHHAVVVITRSIEQTRGAGRQKSSHIKACRGWPVVVGARKQSEQEIFPGIVTGLKDLTSLVDIRVLARRVGKNIIITVVQWWYQQQQY